MDTNKKMHRYKTAWSVSCLEHKIDAFENSFNQSLRSKGEHRQAIKQPTDEMILGMTTNLKNLGFECHLGYCYPHGRKEFRLRHSLKELRNKLECGNLSLFNWREIMSNAWAPSGCNSTLEWADPASNFFLDFWRELINHSGVYVFNLVFPCSTSLHNLLGTWCSILILCL